MLPRKTFLAALLLSSAFSAGADFPASNPFIAQ